MACVAGSLKPGGVLAGQQCLQLCSTCTLLTSMLLRSQKILFTSMNVDAKKLSVSTYSSKTRGRYFPYCIYVAMTFKYSIDLIFSVPFVPFPFRSQLVGNICMLKPPC